MLERTHAAGVPFAPRRPAGSRSCRDGSAAGRWVTADSVYGADHALRRWLQDHAYGYVLAVTRAQRLGFGRVEELVSEVPPQGWHRLSAGDGAKGPRLYDWTYLPYGGDAAPGWEKGLLIRRGLAAAPRARLLPDPCRRRHGARRPRPGRRHALDDRGLLRGGQGRGRPRPVRGPLLDRLAPPRHARHAGPRLPRRAAQGRRRGRSPRSTWPPSSCRSPSRSCAACSGTSSGPTGPTSRPRSLGHAGAAAISNAPDDATGSAVLALKPGCSTRAPGRAPSPLRGSGAAGRCRHGRSAAGAVGATPAWPAAGRSGSCRRPDAASPRRCR